MQLLDHYIPVKIAENTILQADVFPSGRFASGEPYSCRISHRYSNYTDTDGVITTMHPADLWNLVLEIQALYTETYSEEPDTVQVLYFLCLFHDAIPVSYAPEGFEFDLDLYQNWDLGTIDRSMNKTEEARIVKISEEEKTEIIKVATQSELDQERVSKRYKYDFGDD